MEYRCQYPECSTSTDYVMLLGYNAICKKCLYEWIMRYDTKVNPFTGEQIPLSILEELESFVTMTRYHFIVVNTAITPFSPGRSFEFTLTWFATIGDLVVSAYSHYSNKGLVLYTGLKLPDGRLITQNMFPDNCSVIDDGERFNTLQLVKAATKVDYLLAIHKIAVYRQAIPLANAIATHFNSLKR